MSGLVIRLLGPPEVDIDGVRVDIARGRATAVLAVLALHHPRSVSTSRLVDELWGETPPDQAVNAIQVYVSRLRRCGVSIMRSGDGYRLGGPVRIDATEFEELIEDGETLLRAGASTIAHDRLAAALALVRGPMLAGLESMPFSGVEITRLNSMRATAHLSRIEADMQLRLYREVLPELAALSRENPANEDLVALHMRALFGLGRHADAIARYDEGRHHLGDVYGLAPSDGLRALHLAMLTGEFREPTRHTGMPVPRQAPAGAAIFVGRDLERGELLAHLFTDNPRGSASIVAVDGPGGVGKTALAVDVARRVSDRYPDGVLFASLGGGEPNHAPTAEAVLGWFLTSLGVSTEALPGGADPAAARYRSELTGKQLLVILDDAVDADQVRLLLPSAAGCGALVTSRSPLLLTEAHSVELGLLPRDDSVELLVRLGRLDPSTDLAATTAVADACGHLPLALEIAGGRLNHRSFGSVVELAEQLEDERHRLDELRLGDRDVRSSFMVSYRQLDPVHQRAFQLLSMLRGHVIDIGLAAATLDTGTTSVEEILRRFVGMRLIDGLGPGRYRFHDLLRLFGQEQADLHYANNRPEQHAALRRALHYELDAARKADSVLASTEGPVETSAERIAALRWFESMATNLVAAATLASNSDDPATIAVAWELGDALFRYLDLTKQWGLWEPLCQVGVDAARRNGHVAGEAAALSRLGCVLRERGRADAAVACLRRALLLARTQDSGLLAKVLNHLGMALQDAGRISEAITFHREGLALARQGDDRYVVAVGLNNLGDIHLGKGQHDQAAVLFGESRDILLELGNQRRALGMTLHNLGEVALTCGRPADAVELFESGAEHSGAVDDRYSQAHCLIGVGNARYQQGDPAMAVRAWEHAHTLLQTIDAVKAADVAELVQRASSHVGDSASIQP